MKSIATPRIELRPEARPDRPAVRAVNEAAFDTAAEADLVEALNDKRATLVSLVAVLGDEIVGHILFSRVSLDGRPELQIAGLAPMAVLPRYQRSGIGSALVREGLTRCESLGCDAAVVVGHPAYYPRFGFVSAARHSLRCEYDVPIDVFMVAELRTAALRDASGLIRYDGAFRGL